MPTPPSNSIIVHRTGERALEFTGTVAATDDGADAGCKQWHSIRVFRVDDAAELVVVVDYAAHPDLRDEVARTSAWRVPDVDGVVDALTRYDPVADVQGYAPGSNNHRRLQKRLLANVRARFGAQITNVFAQLGIGAAQ